MINAGRAKKFIAAFLTVLLAVTAFPAVSSAEGDDTGKGRLIDGSFENMVSFEGAYKQLAPKETDPWQTTAETNLIEYLKANTGTYINNVTVKPSDGDYAVELNADEESSLFQIVNTEPSSLYEWGLDHAARTESETMALIIGPNQDVLPSKNWGEGHESSDLNYEDPPVRTGYKYGKDQMMQMVDWLKATGVIGSTRENYGLANSGKAIVLYSKKFDEHGGFKDNSDNQPFSMTPSSIYTEKWCVWVITDHNTTAAGATNPWGSYGLNAENGGAESGSEADLSKYYLYSVPSGQTKTLFAFTSVDNTPPPGKVYENPTYGNFIDGINFNIYRSLSGSVTPNGSAVIGASDGSSEGEGAGSGHEVTVDHSVAAYVADGEALTIQGKIAAADKDNVTFAGVYYTTQDPDGSGAVTRFIKSGEGWTVTTDEAGDTIYSYELEQVSSAVNLHFVFVKSPLIIYDVNGGKPYRCTEQGSNVEGEQDYVYSFRPESDEIGMKYVYPYESHAPEGLNDGWKFTGWQLTDDNGTTVLLPAVHKIACSYQQKTEGDTSIRQRFVVLGDDKNDVFNKPETTLNGITWSTDAVPLYNDDATGLTMTAQWRWRQAFKPQVKDGADYTDSADVGSISLAGINDDNENYDPDYEKGNGAGAYFAETNETITAVAEPAEGYYFEGWYDENGSLVSTNPQLTYVETIGSVNTYYARFTKKLTQRYIRQIKNENGQWTDLDDDDDSKVPLLDHTSLSEGAGTVVSSTASNNSEYGLIGWFDEKGNQVDESMVCNGGKSIRYAVEKDATYYARYEEAVTAYFKMQYIENDGTLTDLNASNSYGSLSVASVSGVPGDTVSSKAYAKQGYAFAGWYDGPGADAKAVAAVDSTDSKIITPQLTYAENQIYYARFKARTDTKYVVQHYFRNYTTGKDELKQSNTYYGTTGELVTPTVSSLLTDSAYEGYVCTTAPETKAILANGGLVFRLYYTKTPVSLTFNANVPEGEAASGTVDDIPGYAGWDVTIGTQEYSRDGYIFNGWNTAPDGTGVRYSAGDSYNMLALNGDDNPNVLYAQWASRSDAAYKVKHIRLSSDGKAVNASEEYTYYGPADTNVTAEPKTYTGYTFDSSNVQNITSGKIIAGETPLELKLYYTPNPTTLTYKPNGGEGSDFVVNGHVDDQLTVEEGSVFTRPGYSFSGWTTPAGASYAANSTYTLTAGDDVLLAQWTARTDTVYNIYHYKVSLDGMSAEVASTATRTGKTGSIVTASPISIDGYTYKSSFCSNNMETSPSGVIAGDGSLVLRLYYTPSTVTLTYDPNGGAGTPDTVTGRYSETAEIAGGIFTRQGYTFAGWTENADGTGNSYKPGSTYTFREDNKTIYAVWEADTDTKYTVEHYKLDASGENPKLALREEKQGTTDSPVEAVERNFTGYSFAALDNRNVRSGTVAPDGSLLLKLYYNPDTAYLEYYANDGGSAKEVVTGKVDQSIPVKENMFTRAGYTFTGWNTARDGSGTKYAEESEYILTAGNSALYAQWRAEPAGYTVRHFKVNALGTDSVLADEETLEAPVDSSITAEAEDYPGYDYMPRYYNGNMITVNTGTVKLDGSLVLNLYYVPKDTGLIYKANGGTGKDVIDGGKVDEKKQVQDNMFTRSGYKFTGWNTAADGSGEACGAGDIYTLDVNGGVLYAQWEKIPGDPAAPGDTGSGSGNETGTGDAMPIRTLAGIVVISAITAMILMGNRRRRKTE